MGVRRSTIPLSLIENAKQLEWISRELSQQYLYGKHESKQIGTGLEFEQYRPYIQGDDLRQLDWKLYAKTGKYFIRQSPVTSQNHLHQIIDNSASMDYREASYSKLELAKIMCGALSYISVNQGDTFSWNAGKHIWDKTGGHKKWQISINKLFQLDSTKKDTAIQSYAPIGKLIWFTDLYLDNNSIKNILSLNQKRGIELIMVNLVGKAEEELSFDKSVNFKDLETGEAIELNTDSYRNSYKDKLAHHQSEIRELCLSYRVPHLKIYIDNPLEQSLRSIVNQVNLLKA